MVKVNPRFMREGVTKTLVPRNEENSRKRSKSLGIVFLMLISVIAPVSISSVSADVITSNTTWSGNYTLSSDLTIEAGSTLTIQPGAIIDAREYAIIVNGTLIATDADFVSTVTGSSSSHGAGLWTGIIGNQNSQITLDRVSISGAETALLNHGDASVSLSSVQDVYIGIDNHGDLTLSNTSILASDVYGIRNQGNMEVHFANISNSSVGLINTGQLSVYDTQIRNSAVGFDLDSGTASLQRISTAGMLVGIASQEGANVDVYSWIGNDLALALDLSNSDNFSLEYAVVDGLRFVYATSLQSSSIIDSTFTGDVEESAPTIDVNCAGTCDFDQLNISSVTNAISINGQGDSTFSNSTVSSSGRIVDLSGTGSALFAHTSLTSSGSGISVSSADLNVENSELNMAMSNAPALVLLGGEHTLDGLYINKTYSQSDTSSLAIDVDYTTISGSMLFTSGFATGMEVLSSSIEIDSIVLFDGEQAGINLIDSQLHSNYLRTRVQDNGAVLDDSELTVGLWEANLHSVPLLVNEDSSAIIRDFRPQNRGGIADAMGDGQLLWGGNSTPSLLTSTSEELLETPVTFTDLSGFPVRAHIEANRFSLIADENGAATLPLLQSGSVVDASLNGSGVRDTLTGGQLGQQMQLPVIPLGDWVIQSGVNAILTEKQDGSPHYLFGDLDLRSGSSLTLKNTILNLSAGHEVEIEAGANLYGESGVLKTDLVALQGNAGIFGSGETGLVLDGPVNWACTSTRDISNIRMTSTLSLPPLCDVRLTNGSVEGMITVGTQGSFELLTTFSARALDKGEPIVGANIIINGETSQTDSDGMVSVTESSLTVTDQGRVETGTVTVQFNSGDITQLYSWNTISSQEHDFIASSITSGVSNDWIQLEEIWSPYYLANDLTIAEFGVLTVRDGVELRLSEGVSINAVGRIEIGDATLQSTGSGARWSGIVVNGIVGTNVEINGANILESSPAIHVTGRGDVTILDSTFARSSGSDPLIQIDANSNSNFHISSSTLTDSGAQCLYAQGESNSVNIVDVTLRRCGGDGAYLRSTTVAINGLEISEIQGKGIHLTDVSGSLNGLNASIESGESALVMDYLSSGFSSSNLSLNSPGAPAISGTFNDDFVIDGAIISSIPGIDMDDSSGAISNIIINGNGSGAGIIMHHSARESMVLENITISQVSVGISLHDDGDWQDSATLELRASQITAQTVISSDSYPVNVHQSSLVGNLDVSSSQIKMYQSRISGQINSVNSMIMLYSNHFIDATFQGQQVPVTVSIDSPFGQAYALTKSGSGVEIDVLYQLTDSNETTSNFNQSMTVSSQGLPSELVNFTTGLDSERNISVLFSGNEAPSVQFERPYSGQRFMETELINATVSVTDDLTEVPDLSVTWTLTDNLGRLVMNGPLDTNWPITDIQAGEYVIEVIVTDHLGASTTRAIDVVVTLLDSDGDWTSSCDDDTGRDAIMGVYCGPDVSDADDDNDGILDDDDAWPSDPCVSRDTDEDGQPDDIDCPEGFTTYLVEDQDDDGDGVMDGFESSDESQMSPIVLALLVIIPIVLMIFLFKRRGGSGGEKIDLSGLDQRHL